MWKPWVPGTGNNWKPLSWKHSQMEELLTNRIVCKALCKSMYAGGWAAGVLFTRLQWSLSTWKSASLSWAGQTDLWKVTHILEGITSATHTLLSSTPSTVLTTADLHSLHSPDYCRPSLLAHFTAAVTNKKQSNRMEINSEKGFLHKQEDFWRVTLCKLFRNSQAGKAKQYFQKRKVSGVMLNWNILQLLMSPAMQNLLKNTA